MFAGGFSAFIYLWRTRQRRRFSARAEDVIAASATHASASGVELRRCNAKYGLALRTLRQHGREFTPLFGMRFTTSAPT
jgi:hypothetical protein